MSNLVVFILEQLEGAVIIFRKPFRRAKFQRIHASPLRHARGAARYKTSSMVYSRSIFIFHNQQCTQLRSPQFWLVSYLFAYTSLIPLSL